MPRPDRLDFPTSRLLTLVGDAAIAGPIMGGLLVPVLIVDTTERADVEELVRVHDLLSPGDVECQWAFTRRGEDRALLVLRFRHPVALEVGIAFSIETHAILVDCILQSHALYLQPGKAGDRSQHRVDAPRILVEVPDTGFRSAWERMLLKRMTIVMAKRTGRSRSKSRPVAKAAINEMRALSQFRLSRRS